MEQTTLQHCKIMIEGMDCPGCAKTIERGLQEVPGVESVQVHFLEERADVAYDLASINDQDITEAINRLGYTPLKLDSEAESMDAPHPRHPLQWPITLMIISGMLTGLGFIFVWFDAPAWYIKSTCIFAIFAGGALAARRAIAALRQPTLDMNVLMTIAVIGAMLIGEWTEGAMVAFLFALANYLEMRSMNRARQAIHAVMTLAPQTALVVRDGQEMSIPVKELQINDMVIIKPGDHIPIDGIVLEGHSSVNQAPITGESIPVEKQVKDTVFAGTVNGEGALTIHVTTHADTTMLARIVHLVEEAQTRQAPVQRFVDRFARIYTPIVIGLAALVAVVPPVLMNMPFIDWFYRALVLLVISCPCALVISTPVAIISALTTAAKYGVLIKGGRYLEQLGILQVLAFDKTGTLSEGHPSVTDVVSFNGMSENDLLTIAASIESRSEHPIAHSIVDYAHERSISPKPVVQFFALPGSGARVELEQKTYYIGNPRLFSDQKLITPEIDQCIEDIKNQGKTAVLLGTDIECMGIIALMDQPRQEAASVIENLRREGIHPLVMLTGDHEITAKEMANQIGVDSFHANLLPDEKISAIQNLSAQYGMVGMVGDGINDAPALAEATVGIAMGHIGTATALETADVVLMRDDLRMLVPTIRLSRRTRGVIFQNIVVAIVLKVLFLLLAMLGLATLWMAVVADMGASLLVIFNGLRLLKNV